MKIVSNLKSLVLVGLTAAAPLGAIAGGDAHFLRELARTDGDVHGEQGVAALAKRAPEATVRATFDRELLRMIASSDGDPRGEHGVLVAGAAPASGERIARLER